MSADRWQQLARIANARFQKESQAMQLLQRDAHDLAARRDALKRMSDRAKDALRDVQPAHYTSGDVQWQSWVSKNTAELNMEAARLRVRKESLLPTLRQVFAQKQACEEIAQVQRKKPSGCG